VALEAVPAQSKHFLAQYSSQFGPKENKTLNGFDTQENNILSRLAPTKNNPFQPSLSNTHHLISSI